MKKVLLISRGYYPCNSPSAHRAAKLVKYLPKFGWEPVVICADWNPQNSGGRYDFDLSKTDTCMVVRVPYVTYKNSSIRGLGDRFARKLIPLIYPFQLFRDMRRVASKLIKQIQFDSMIASAPPFMTLNIAGYLHRQGKIPWLADFRDLPDELDDGIKWIQQIQVCQETAMCASASVMTTVSKPLADKLSVRYKTPVHVVYNGFDPDDFPPPSDSISDYFTIVYCGLIYADRNPSILFDALDSILNKGKIDLNCLRVRFYGVQPNDISRYLNGRSCARIVQAMGRVPFHEIVSIEQQSSALLLLTHPYSKGIITSKVFEYLGARRPILAVPGDGDVVDAILKETGAGTSCNTIDELVDLIGCWYTEWEKQQTIAYGGVPEKMLKYTRLNQAERIARLLDAISG